MLFSSKCLGMDIRIFSEIYEANGECNLRLSEINSYKIYKEQFFFF